MKRAAIALLVLLAACCPPDPKDPSRIVRSPPPVSGDALKLLTWNVFLMPSWIGESPKNDTRGDAIAEVLSGLDYDILALEKVFDRWTRYDLTDALREKYPYQYGPANYCCGVTLTSGVMVMSRIPLTDYHEIEFHRLAGFEKLSRKGAMLLTGEFKGHRFHLVATHLQGDDGPSFNAEHQAIRNEQMQQIRDELLAKYADPAIPWFLCGDLSTPRFWPEGGAVPGVDYTKMLATFGARNGPDYRITLDDDLAHNDLASDDKKRTAEMDYILVRPNGSAVTGTWERLILRRRGWDGAHGRQDLSYRYAVGAAFTFQ